MMIKKAFFEFTTKHISRPCGTYASGAPGSAQSDQKMCMALEQRQPGGYELNVDYITKARRGAD